MKLSAIVAAFKALIAFLQLLAGVRQKLDENTAEMERAKAEKLDKEELDKEVSRWTKP